MKIFSNDELFLGRPEVVSDLNTNFLIWHGTSATNSLTKNILNTQDTPPEGNSTAIFFSDFINIPSNYNIIKRKSDGKKILIGSGLDLDSSDLSNIDFSNTIGWFNKYGKEMKKYDNSFILTNYIQTQLNLFYSKLSLIGSNLNNVNFTSSDLGNISLIGCNLNKCTFNGTILLNTILYDEDFSDQKKHINLIKEFFLIIPLLVEV